MASAAVEEDLHAVPTYWLCINRIYNSTVKYIIYRDNSTTYSPLDFYRNLKRSGDVSWTDYQVVFVLAFLWTALRCLLTWKLFAPLASSLQMLPTNAQKFPESVWKLFFYCSTWFSVIFVLFRGNYDYFQRPLTIWQDWEPSMVIPDDIYWVYMVEFSFYLHSVYATLYMDHWRKDSIVMLFHHFLTMSLLGFSYAARYHKVGILVLFMHDVTDICLEFTKCNVYMKNRGGKYYAIHEHMSTLGFLFFAGTWYVFRLYWFPLKVLYSCTFGVDMFGPNPQKMQFYLFFNGSLWILQMLNIYWFYFILNFIYKVATGQMKEVDDLRENEVAEKFNQKFMTVPMANGFRHENGINCYTTSLSKTSRSQQYLKRERSGDTVKTNGTKRSVKTD